MIARMAQGMGLTLAVALVVAALWGWGQSTRIAENANRPELAMWAVRSAALSAVAGAQVLLLTFVVGAIYQRRGFDDVLRLIAGGICTIALVGAIALLLVQKSL